MRFFTIVFLCAASVCLAQESYHNEEFEFTIDIPLEWNISFEDAWTDEVKAYLEKLYTSKTLLMLNPLDTRPHEAPCIQISAQKVWGGIATRQAIAFVKRTGEKLLTVGAESLTKDLLGQKIKQYHKIDTFYDYYSSKKCAIIRILYQHNDHDIYFLSAMAKFAGPEKVVNFRGYWTGDTPEEFWEVFNETVNSFEFDRSVGNEGFVSTVDSDQILKWVGYILGISIVLGILKKLLFD